MGQFFVALKGIIVKDNRILVLKRSSREEVYVNLWDIPGGRMHFGEAPHSSLKREILEETGLAVEIKHPFKIWSFHADESTQIVGITLICRYIEGEVTLSHEHTEYRWILPQEFERLDADKNLKKEVAEFAADLLSSN